MSSIVVLSGCHLRPDPQFENRAQDYDRLDTRVHLVEDFGVRQVGSDVQG